MFWKLEKKYYRGEIDLDRVKYLGGKFLRGFEGAVKKMEMLMTCKRVEEIYGVIDILSSCDVSCIDNLALWDGDDWLSSCFS